MHKVELSKQQIDDIFANKFLSSTAMLIHQLKKTLHICDCCKFKNKTCKLTDVTFGFNNKNIIRCDKFRER